MNVGIIDPEGILYRPKATAAKTTAQAKRTTVPPRSTFASFMAGTLPLFLLFHALAAACHPSPVSTRPVSTGPVFTWPAPEGWKKETIPFPLDFAPDLPHRGAEEIRFAPHFFDPAAPTYFSYSFAWVIDDPAPPPADQLSAEFRRYFAGLMGEVGKEKGAAYPASAFDARVDSDRAGHYGGVIHAVDAFGDGRPLVLHLDAQSSTCRKKTVLLVTLSPKDPDDAVFAALLAQRGTFRCAP